MDVRTRIAVVVLTVVAFVGFTSGASGAASGGASPAQLPTAQLAPPVAAQPPSENHYVPITPCRIVDTRAGTGTGGTPFSALQTRTYYVSGTFGFAPQGGKTGGCGIPSGVVALSASFLVVSPTGAGRIHAWPNGTTEPTATTFYYGNHTGSDSSTVTVNATTSYSLKVRNYNATTDLVIDVTGYYVKPLAAVIDPDGDLYSGSSRALSSSRISTGQYRIKFDRYVRNCTVTAGGYAGNVTIGVNQFTYASDNTVELRTFNSAGASSDQYSNVQVSC